MRPPKPEAIDRDIVAKNIALVRKAQALTQMQLAVKAKVSLPSVSRAEKAQSVRLSTLRKIATQGLNVHFDTLLIPKLNTTVAVEIVIHRAADESWYAISDSRPHLPEDDLLRNQDPIERIRLGQLGFVPGFMAPPTAITKDGPGLALLEVYKEMLGPFNAEFYKDAVMYVIRGKAKVGIGSDEVEVSKGDWVGYKTADLVMLGPAAAPGSPEFPALVLWIGANRRSKKSKLQN